MSLKFGLNPALSLITPNTRKGKGGKDAWQLQFFNFSF
jgi:hypothetical protein